jgi:hypothetical protein
LPCGWAKLEKITEKWFDKFRNCKMNCGIKLCGWAGSSCVGRLKLCGRAWIVRAGPCAQHAIVSKFGGGVDEYILFLSEYGQEQNSVIALAQIDETLISLYSCLLCMIKNDPKLASAKAPNKRSWATKMDFLPTGLIVLVVCLVFLAAACCCGWCWCRRRRATSGRKQGSQVQGSGSIFRDQGPYSGSTFRDQGPY